MGKKFYITTPIYYVNDVPHLGHAYTTVAADVLARHYRRRGYEVRFLTGTDEHGDKNADAAAKVGLTPQQYVDGRAAEFKQTFEALGVEFRTHNIFMRTTAPFHRSAVDVFMQKLDAAGALYEGDYEGRYCRGCEDFKTEKDLVDGRCPIHKTEPELLREKNWFFRLSVYSGQVKRLIESGELVVAPEGRRNEVLSLLDQELPDFSVTRQRVKWGVPFFKDPSQIVYVWVEALQNYISALGYPNGVDFKEFWPADVHLMAKDILKFHAVYWPAMLLAAGERPPAQVFAHGFFTLNGQKMSKTVGNVIDPRSLVAQYGADATRYLLLSQFPFGNDGDIQADRFTEKYNADLANGLGNLVSRTATLIEQNCDGKVDHTVEPLLSISGVGAAIEALAFDRALDEVFAAIKLGNQLIDRTKPWEKKEESASFLSGLASGLVAIGHALTPFVPTAGAHIVSVFSAELITKQPPLFARK